MRTVYLNFRAVVIVVLGALLMISALMALVTVLYSRAERHGDVGSRTDGAEEPPNLKRHRPPPLVAVVKKGPIRADRVRIANNNDGQRGQQRVGEGANEEPEETDREEGVARPPPPPRQEDSEDEVRREKVKEMMRHAWAGYRRFAWGANELRPLANSTHSQPIFGGPAMLATIVDAADTLWLMDEKEEYARARDYIRDEFDVKKATGPVSVFEITIRYLGAFLALHALTGEQFYVSKAVSLANALLPAFNTPTGVSTSLVNVHTGEHQNYAWASGASSILSEFGSLHLEFTYLSHLTGNSTYADKVNRIRRVVHKSASPIKGLYPNYMNAATGKWVGDHHSLGALGDSFYEYLLKSHLLNGDVLGRRMYLDSSRAIMSTMVRHSAHDNLTYVAELRHGAVEHKMGHLACFAPGMFALEAALLHSYPTMSAGHEAMALAEELGHTCHESYVRAEASGIGPEMFYFSPQQTRNGKEATAKGLGESGYMLRPEAIESWFYLWRLTGKKKYKEWVWTAISAIDRHCRVPNGFVGLRDVYDPERGYDDVQQSYFLAETLKYAYLTFADEALLPLDKWVFNTEAHPLPSIKGSHAGGAAAAESNQAGEVEVPASVQSKANAGN